ncbi:fructokinase [Herbihabitans rhizosphaerae]|uniref:Fructokinase n=1 Tax=Herbihabitans rhizosphaerae TaxID=1872711 RepID=A0A4Q7KWD4_9PSEU|nr:carbohydrate kinase [Herbihabitans rhizosphaerae]RZS40967.1 fructokinase [Herbihabitans rhizosphaerae]
MIVVGGEALVDLLPDGAGVSTVDGPLLPRLGGAGFNVAIAAGRLGAEVSFLSRLSTDSFGAALLAALRESTVDTSLTQRGDEPTSLAVAGVGGDGSADYTFYVEGTADRLVADPGPLPAGTTILSLGAFSLVLEPGATTYERVLRAHARAGGIVVLDPNVRSSLVSDPDAYRARFESWLPDIALLKLSVDDARWLAGCDDIEPAVRRWQAAGPAAVVLTRGADGLECRTARGDTITVPAVPVEVADTVGAGDTVHGTLLAWLQRNGVTSPAALRELSAGEWRTALEFAAEAAAITASRTGAQPPTAAELPAWL